MASGKQSLRVGSRLGKFRLDRRIGVGGFATVYAATDTLLGIKVALKIPSLDHVSDDMLEEFRREARMMMKLDHPNIQPIRDATFIDDYFVIVSPLAEKTLDDRLKKRMAFDTACSITQQLYEAVAHAHEHKVIHCDIKPENILMFGTSHVRLADFGIAKVAQATISGSGTGTVGYMSPEQAMGKPSARSDVFSLGLLTYRMFSSHWPEYPFRWPFPGAASLKKRLHPDVIAMIRKSLSIEPHQRFRDANQLLRVWNKNHLRAIRHYRKQRGES